MRDADGNQIFENGLIIPERYYDILASAQVKISDALYTISKTAAEMQKDMRFEKKNKALQKSARHLLNMCEKIEDIIRECDEEDINTTGNNRAKWIVRENVNYSPFAPFAEENEYFCSRCRGRQGTLSNFCPICGAKMEMEGEHDRQDRY